MSWIEKLSRTYEACAGSPRFEAKPLWPVSHTEQQAHLELVIDGEGNFERASLVDKESTVVPATEKSAGRTGVKPPPHPLCDKVQYCASDYPAYGGKKTSFYQDYVDQLRTWCLRDPEPKLKAILKYVEKGTVVRDLVAAKLLHCSPEGELLTVWAADTPAPGIFRSLTAKGGERDQGDAFIRWRVQIPGDLVSAIWQDPAVRDSWIRFDALQNEENGVWGLCMVSGEKSLLATSHPKRVRSPADQAKLISANDLNGFTFRGRFGSAGQAGSVGSVVTQRAHNALRWLIERQGYRDSKGDQVFVSWSVLGKRTPGLLDNTAVVFGFDHSLSTDAASDEVGDVGQSFAQRLNRAIAGYKSDLSDTDEMAVLGLDSATDGRMAVTYYRELTASEFLERVQGWHHNFAWAQRYSNKLQFDGAPSPRDIAECAYGRRLDDKLRKTTVERFVPCIVDSRPIPRDVVRMCVRRATNRIAFKQKESSEWEKCLGIACAVFRGSKKEEGYHMSLEENRTTRDYLFGRLLAIGENIESLALRVAGEKRDTNAARLMQRFADHPCSTWRTIELALTPYKTRLRTSRPGPLTKREKLLDEVIGKFKASEFTTDGKLSGEFLLGYHCQRAALWTKSDGAEISGAGPEFGDGDSEE